MEDAALADYEIDLTSESLEELRVRQWRLDQLVRLGFSEAVAAAMTASAVDLAEARKLVAAGCPLGTAARILL
jgi:hypothetical protein